jgi:hypothetical protein
MGENSEQDVLKESPSEYRDMSANCDLLMLEDSLAMSPWERILANDDAVNFGDSLRAAMEKRNAKSR